MPEASLCPNCGAVLSADAPGGACLRCLARLAAGGLSSNLADDDRTEIADPNREASSPTSRHIGDYELISELGRGGMGVVWRARQRSLGREVALKLIKFGMDSGPVLARFEAERQVLARMDHPNIARVIDAGTTQSGRPYFVMELVQGTAITRYCDDRRLSIRERLNLFLSVCHAIEHAHQKGIIHRDIKPGNILVSEQGGEAVPKVIDFGIAKAVGPRLTEESFATEMGALVGTLEYMSPEQAGRDSSDIDTRSDIYGLGILLYELLTGTTPLNRKVLKKAAWDEVIRLIRDKEPPRPSTRLTEIRESLPVISAARKAEPARLPRLLSGDLDWIVMKALEKDRARRYESATSFAQDVQRHLADEPVRARPPSTSYRVHKFIRKHTVGVGIAIGCALLLMASAVVSTWQWRRAELQRAATDALNNRLELQRAEELLASDNSHLALALLARNLRDRPGHHVAQERLVNLLNQRTFLVLSPPTQDSPGRTPADPQIAFRIAASPDLRRSAVVTNAVAIALLEASSGKMLSQWNAHSNVIRSIAFSADGAWLLSASADGTARLWDPKGARLIHELRHPAPLHFAAFDHAGTLIATAGRGGVVRFWETRNGTQLAQTVQHGRSINSVRFSLEDASVVTTDDEGVVRIWSVATGLSVTEVLRMPGTALDATFNDEGTGLRVVSRGSNGLVEHGLRWTLAATPILATAVVSQTMARDDNQREVVAISPNGSLQAMGSLDGTVQLWDVGRGVPLCDPIQHGQPVNGLAFSPDSRRFATSAAGSKGRVWDSTTGQPLTDWFRFAQPVSSVRFASDGRQVVFATPTGSVTWPLHRAEGNAPRWLPELAEAIAGVQFTEQRLTRVVSLGELLAVKERIVSLPEAEPLKSWAVRLLGSIP